MNTGEYTGWIQTDTTDDAGQVGGDNQVGPAHGKKFLHPDKPGRVIAVYAYAVVYENDALDGGVEYGVEELIKRRIYTGPGEPEGWEDLLYTAIDGYPELRNAAEATEAAVKHLAGVGADDLSWNGVKS